MVVVTPLGHITQSGVVAAYDFLLGCLTAHFIIGNAEPGHVDAHIGGRLVGTLSVDAFEDGVQHGEYLDVAVIVDGSFAIGLQMEMVDHVHIVQVGSCSLVSHGMLQWNVPDGERLELGVAGLDATAVLVVELRQAHRHLSASWAGCRNHHERTCGLHVVVLAESFFRVDKLYVGGIALDEIVVIHLYLAEPL